MKARSAKKRQNKHQGRPRSKTSGKNSDKLRQPPCLKPGSTLALIAPAFQFDPKLLQTGRDALEREFGIHTVMDEGAFSRHGYFAGTDARREDELFRWLADNDVDGVLAIRGGYGCARIYPGLIRRLKTIKGLKPKIVAGCSDLTVLLNGLHQDLGWATFHSPVAAGRPFREPVPLERETFFRSLFTASPLGSITDPAMTVLSTKTAPKSAKGPIVGGCLSIVLSSLGTSYEVQTKGKVLFLEDVDERPYRLDRMLTQLKQAGKLDGIKALVFGQMVGCDPAPADRDPEQTTAEQAIRMALGELVSRIPILYNFPAGHGKPQATFPIGTLVEVQADGGTARVDFLQAGAG